MASSSDLFSFGLMGRKQMKEQVTPHKISLLALIYQYCELKKKQTIVDEIEDVDKDFMTNSGLKENERLTEELKSDFITVILELLQSADLPLEDLIEKLKPLIRYTLYEDFNTRLKDFYENGVLSLMDFFQELSKLLPEPSTFEPIISSSSVLGLFLRRMILAFDKLSFTQVTMLHSHYKLYYEEVHAPPPPPLMEESGTFGGSLIDSINSQSGGDRLTRSGLVKNIENELKSGEGESAFYSYKQAEYFISKQGFLLQHNENEAMSPGDLQQKITKMLQANPDLAEAHFLSYLNNLRIKEYCTAIYNLYHYFDRSTTLSTDTNAVNKTREDEVFRRYGALNLAALHFRFGHREESLAALHEAIRMAQETNDNVCLQHALSWLHRIEDSGSNRAANLMARSVDRSVDLRLPNITSLGIQALAKHDAFATVKPASVFEYLLKSDILNCKHSQSHFMCVSYAQKSALWNLYGKRESASMAGQLVLNLDTSEAGIYHDGEAVCIALCNMAKLFADNGEYPAALEIVNQAKQRFPSMSQHSYIWMICEQEIVFDRALLNRRWSAAEQAVTCIRAFDAEEANLRRGIVDKEMGKVTEALTGLNKLLEKIKQESAQRTPDFRCRLLLLTLAELYIQTDNTTSAISHVLECLNWAKDHHLQFMVAMATFHLAYVQFHMQLPELALSLLDQQMITVLSHGSGYDRARSLYCYAKCKVAASLKSPESDRKEALLLAVSRMNTVIELFKKIEAYQREKDAIYYQARLYNELGYISEMNKCAYLFKQLDQQYPTLNRVAVNVL
ncbi:hypothetical protein FSP39_024561 [Pinctada imbricata]|uniref:Anaphase-promoting complex subunit 5 n=1 Tax=Pinctada imbricata TaxID=66713 RepID=A0AA88XMY4_PINIB|nr:hypothetical protein FSP39_024561 [Pinctada imbricata]